MAKFKIHFLKADSRDPLIFEAETFLLSTVGTHVFVDAQGQAVGALGHVNFDHIEKLEEPNA